MKIIEPPKTIIENPDSLFGYFAWPTVARLQDGTLATTCSGFRLAHVCPFGKAVISYSRDEGKNWTNAMPVIDTPLDDRDSGILVAGDKVIVTSFNNNAKLQRRYFGWEFGCRDERQTLADAYLNCIPTSLEEQYLGSTYVISRDGGYTFGEIKKSPVTSPHGPCVTPDGRILWVGRLFDADDKPTAVACCELNDNDEFVKIAELPTFSDEYGTGDACEPYAVCFPDGRILVASRVERSGEHSLFTVATCESTDGGKTFTKFKRIIGEDDGAPPHLMIHSSGKLILVYACRAEGRRGIRVRISEDGGRSFGEEYRLSEDSETLDLGYPASVERNDGSILTVYYEHIGNRSVIKQTVWEL